MLVFEIETRACALVQNLHALLGIWDVAVPDRGGPTCQPLTSSEAVSVWKRTGLKPVDQPAETRLGLAVRTYPTPLSYPSSFPPPPTAFRLAAAGVGGPIHHRRSRAREGGKARAKVKVHRARATGSSLTSHHTAATAVCSTDRSPELAVRSATTTDPRHEPHVLRFVFPQSQPSPAGLHRACCHPIPLSN